MSAMIIPIHHFYFPQHTVQGPFAKAPTATPPTNGLTYIASSCTTTASSDSSTVHCRHPPPAASVISIRCSTAQDGMPLASKNRGPMTRSGALGRGSLMQRGRESKERKPKPKYQKKKKKGTRHSDATISYILAMLYSSMLSHSSMLHHPATTRAAHAHTLRSNATAPAMILDPTPSADWTQPRCCVLYIWHLICTIVPTCTPLAAKFPILTDRRIIECV